MATLSHTLSSIDPQLIKVRFAEEISEHKSAYVLQGLLFILLGIAAAILPGLFALSADILIGVLLLLGGVIQLFLSHRSRMHWWALLSASLSIIVGGLMIVHPGSGLLALITLIMAFLFAEGIFEILLAMQFYPLRRWAWMLFSGIVALALAAILWKGFPVIGVLYLGWIIALNLFLYGVALVMLVSHIK